MFFLYINKLLGFDKFVDLVLMLSFPADNEENLNEQLERLLRILREFCADPILCDYVIDALWEKCSAMKVSHLFLVELAGVYDQFVPYLKNLKLFFSRDKFLEL